jgi:hypothetical protein
MLYLRRTNPMLLMMMVFPLMTLAHWQIMYIFLINDMAITNWIHDFYKFRNS